MTDRQCLRCGDPLQSSSAISNYCMPCQMRLASSIDTERAARLAAEARVKELEAAGIALYKRWQQFTVERGGWGNQENAYYDLAKHAQHEWNALRDALKEPTNG